MADRCDRYARGDSSARSEVVHARIVSGRRRDDSAPWTSKAVIGDGRRAVAPSRSILTPPCVLRKQGAQADRGVGLPGSGGDLVRTGRRGV